MRIVLFAAMLLIVVSVPAAYAATLQLVTENGNVFSIDFDEILSIWEGYNPSNQTLAIKALELRIDQLVNSTVTNSTSQQDVIDLQNQVTALIAQLNATRTNSTATDASVAILQGQINALVGQLNTVLTNSTATEAEIDALQDTINSLTEDLENLEQDGIGAGALGTSGRMVSAALDGYVIYGEHGKLGTISEATTYNWYTGPVDYIGIIPDKDYFTKYSLDSPNGLYNVQNSELVPVQGSSKLVRTDGYKVLEGNAPVIQDRGRDVEIDVSGKVLVQLDESRLGSGATIGVDTEGVTAQVVTSPNDLINTEYRVFNGTGKFVLFEEEAQYGPSELTHFGSNGPDGSPGVSTCSNDYTKRPHHRCQSTGGMYTVKYQSATQHYRYDKYYTYADTQDAIPHMLDVYVSDVDESFIDSDTMLSVTYGYRHSALRMASATNYYDGVYAVNSTRVDDLWHMTGFVEREGYTIPHGNIFAQGFAAAHGIHRVTDATPYVIRGSVESFSSESIPTTTNSNVYVLLAGIGKDQTYTTSNIVEDITPPVVSSIERHNPSNLVIDSDMLVYNVTFSEDVTGVDADDFVLSPGSTGSTNTTETKTYTNSTSLLIPRSTWGGGTITVPDVGTDMLVGVDVDLGSFARGSDMSIYLRAPDGTTIFLHSNVSPLEKRYLVDFGDGSITGDWQLFMRNTRYSIPLQEWSLSVIPSGAPSPVTFFEGSGDTYYVTVPASQVGTYGISLGLGHGITDLQGNRLADRMPVTDIDREYIVANMVDVSPPSILAIERSNPIEQNTNAHRLTYKVTFSEDVSGVNALDFVLSPDSTGGTVNSAYPVESVSGSGDTYYVTVSATQDGTFNLDLTAGHGIIDAASNPLTDRVPVTGHDGTYVKTTFADTDEPTISSIERHVPMMEHTNNTALIYKVAFSEDVTGVDKTDFIMSSGSTGEPLFTFHPYNQFTYSSSPDIPIRHYRTVTDTITVSESYATSVTVGVDISTTVRSALKVDLIAPDGTTMTLHNRTGGYEDNLIRSFSYDVQSMQTAGNWTLQVYHHYPSARLNDWALTINQGSPHHVASISGSGDTYYATVFAIQNGTYNLDLASSGHGIRDTAGNRLTDTSVASGTARISANGIVGAGSVQINGLPEGAPWVFETVDGQQLQAGITSSSGSITMPLPDYSVEGVTEEFSLLVYEDGFGQNVQPGNIIADTINKEFIRHDFVNPAQNVIYIPERFMLYPITVPVTIDNVRLGKVSTDCNVTDQVRLPYLDGAYDVGSTMHVPFIPGMSALKLSIEGAPVCVKFADVLPPVQIIPFSGDVATEKNAPLINLEVNGGASTILGTNDPTTLTVSFPASGFSEHSRYTNILSVTATGQGQTITCNTNLHFADNSGIFPPSCPEPAASMFMAMHGGYESEMAVALEHAFTKYEVTIDVFKNGHLYDTATLPLNSLNVGSPLGLESEFNLGRCWTASGLNTIPSHVNHTTAYTGGTYFGHLRCTTNPPNALYHATGGTAWSELVTHTFDITDGRIGDHIEVQISNEVTFSFPYFFGHYHPYNSEIAHYDWPSTFTTEIINGDDFLGSGYDKLEFDMYVVYGANDRGVLVQINNGFIMVTPAS